MSEQPNLVEWYDRYVDIPMPLEGADEMNFGEDQASALAEEIIGLSKSDVGIELEQLEYTKTSVSGAAVTTFEMPALKTDGVIYGSDFIPARGELKSTSDFGRWILDSGLLAGVNEDSLEAAANLTVLKISEKLGPTTVNTEAT